MKSFLEGRHQIPNPEGFMSKPIDTEKLMAMVKDLLA